jgi:hypothetical protein
MQVTWQPSASIASLAGTEKQQQYADTWRRYHKMNADAAVVREQMDSFVGERARVGAITGEVPDDGAVFPLSGSLCAVRCYWLDDSIMVAGPRETLQRGI